MHWSVVGKDDPAEISGGLNRYVRGLVQGLVETNNQVDWHVAGKSSSGLVIAHGSGGPVRRIVSFLSAGWNIPADIDVINTHFSMYGVPYLAGARLARVFRFWARPKQLRTMVHFHGPWGQESKVAAIGGWAGPMFKSLLDRWVLRSADVVVVLSDAFAAQARTAGASPTKVVVVRPGLDEFWFQDSSASLELGATINIVCVRRLTPRMGHLQLLDALQELGFSVDARRVILHVVGVGDSRGPIMDWIERNRRSAEVILYGSLSDEELRAVQAASDIAVVPTLALEGFGLVVLEAMAAGIPVISTGQGGLRDAMGPWGVAPYVFDLMNAQSVRSAITAALDLRASEQDRAALVEYARGHSWSAVAKTLTSKVTS